MIRTVQTTITYSDILGVFQHNYANIQTRLTNKLRRLVMVMGSDLPPRAPAPKLITDALQALSVQVSLPVTIRIS